MEQERCGCEGISLAVNDDRLVLDNPEGELCPWSVVLTRVLVGVLLGIWSQVIRSLLRQDVAARSNQGCSAVEHDMQFSSKAYACFSVCGTDYSAGLSSAKGELSP
jgi:hypothetical protein